MSEDEDCDGLPNIFVASSAYDAGAFSIPSADELASQREREVENERKLKELRERHADDDDITLSRHDSSSSESDAVLAAAVTGMSVDCALADHTASPSYYAPRAADLLAALAQGLPTTARPLLEDPNVALRLPEVVASASALVAADDELWADNEVWAVGALLAAAALAHCSAPRAAALRALHTLLERRATSHQALALGRMMLDALPAARTRLELSDALRAGGGPTCEALATLALDVALMDVLDPPARGAHASLSRLAEAMGAGWARLAPELRYTTLQLVGRRLAVAREEEREVRARLLSPLAQTQMGHDTQTPEKLKVWAYGGSRSSHMSSMGNVSASPASRRWQAVRTCHRRLQRARGQLRAPQPTRGFVGSYSPTSEAPGGPRNSATKPTSSFRSRYEFFDMKYLSVFMDRETRRR